MRALTSPQRALLRSGRARANLLADFYLDEGTYRFCDDTRDLKNGATVYIGANALADSVTISSGQDLSAEGVTLTCDGNRMAQAEIADPAGVLRNIMNYLHQQRRVDFQLGLSYPEEENITLAIPVYAGKINSVRLVDADIEFDSDEPVSSRLEIQIDSLATRYGRATFRTRSQSDQHEIDPTDNFYSYVTDAVNNERLLYWGKRAPGGSSAVSIPGIGSGNFGPAFNAIANVFR